MNTSLVIVGLCPNRTNRSFVDTTFDGTVNETVDDKVDETVEIRTSGGLT